MDLSLGAFLLSDVEGLFVREAVVAVAAVFLIVRVAGFELGVCEVLWWCVT